MSGGWRCPAGRHAAVTLMSRTPTKSKNIRNFELKVCGIDVTLRAELGFNIGFARKFPWYQHLEITPLSRYVTLCHAVWYSVTERDLRCTTPLGVLLVLIIAL